METSRMTTNGRMTIPHRIREKFRLKKGTKVVFIEQDGIILVRRLDREYFLSFAGSLGTKGKALRSFMRERKRARKSK